MATAPDTNGTITLRDFTVDMSDTLPAGRNVYRVVDEDPANPHEVAFVKLAPGKTAEDVRNSVMRPAGPAPFSAVGDFQSHASDPVAEASAVGGTQPILAMYH